nr:AAC(3) family N-acetyltransferase [Nitrospirota bacterium]
MITVADVTAALLDVGVAHRQVLLVYSDVAYLGPLAGASSRSEYLTALWNCLREVADDQTTIVMSTASIYLCGSGEDFILETSPCDTGLLNEHMRTQPGTKRSLHPFVSYSANGPRAEALTARISKSGYGVESPMERMVATDARALHIGIPARFSPSVVHHVEQLVGVPYRYYKEFPNRVFAGGQYVGTDYLLYVRNLDADIEKDRNIRLFGGFMEQGHRLDAVKLPSGCVLESYDLPALYRAGIELLREDPYGLLKHPPSKRPYRR